MAITLYLQRQSFVGALTLAQVRRHTSPIITWFSLEPRAALLERDGRVLTGRVPRLSPLATRLPQGLDDLPLLSASLYGERRWLHLHDAHPLSETPGRIFIWSLDPMDGAEKIPDIIVKRQTVLPWQDRARFGLENDLALPSKLHIEHVYRAGRRLTWRIASPNVQEIGA